MTNPPSRIAITGASGLIGSALQEKLAAAGLNVFPMVRRSANPGEIHWDPAAQTCDASALENMDAVVNLAGENLAAHRWTDAMKRRIRDSRVQGTRFLCETLARLEHPPKILVSASAVGYYGDRGDAVLTEESEAGRGFLADVCREWEEATEVAREAGARVVLLRIAPVLTAKGGALAKMLPAFRMGVGGKVGSGNQYMSWVALSDLLSAIEFAMENAEISGPVNAAAPNPVTNREFAQTLGRALRRPAALPLPAPVVRFMFGEMGQTLLLEGSRVTPRRLVEAGFRFRYPDLESALRRALQDR